MANLNRVLLIGNLTRNPELRYTPNGHPVAEFGLAINRFWKGQDGSKQEETTFVDITAWGRTAELANQYLTKGRRVFIEGRLKYDQWTTAEGQKRSKLSVVADNLQFLDSKSDGSGRSAAGQSGGMQPAEEPYGGSPVGGGDFPPHGPADPDNPPF